MADTGNGVYVYTTDDEFENIGSAIGSKGADGKDSTVPGPDGFSPSATVTRVEDGALISITDKEGTTTAKVNDGVKGDPGESIMGLPGADGFSPTVNVEQIERGAVINVQDRESAYSAVINDGKDGADGFSPSARVEKVDEGTKITITDKDGTTETIIPTPESGSTGSQGLPGADGFSPIIATEEVSEGTIVSITSAEGINTFLIKNGKDGESIPGPKGADGRSIVGPRGEDGIAVAWKIRTFDIAATEGRVYFTSLYFWDSDLPKQVGQLLYGQTTTSSFFARIDGFASHGGVENVPYCLIENLTELQAAQGVPGRGILSTEVVFDTTSVTPMTINRQTRAGGLRQWDSIIDSTNKYIATVTSVNEAANTAVIDNIQKIAGYGPTPEVRATATIGNSGGIVPTVTVTQTGSKANPTFNFRFDNVRGKDGNTPSVRSERTSTGARVIYSNGGVVETVNLYDGERGERGERGATGRRGTLTWYTAVMKNEIDIADLKYGGSWGGNVSAVQIGDTVYSGDGYYAEINGIGTRSVTTASVVRIKGDTGPQGIPGVPGRDGRDGRDGVTPNMSNYYTRDEVNALIYNLKGGGGRIYRTIKGTWTFTIGFESDDAVTWDNYIFGPILPPVSTDPHIAMCYPTGVIVRDTENIDLYYAKASQVVKNAYGLNILRPFGDKVGLGLHNAGFVGPNNEPPSISPSSLISLKNLKPKIYRSDGGFGHKQHWATGHITLSFKIVVT